MRVCLDVDAGWRALGGRMRVGAKRSPLHTPAQVLALAQEVLRRPRLRLAGIMAYEAQIAGVGDTPPGSPLRARAIQAMQARSARELAGRRAAIVAAVRRAIDDAGAPALEFVNGGGTGSIERTPPRTRSRRSRRAPASTVRRCSTPTARSRRGPPRCSRCRWCAGPGAAS